MYFYLYFWSLNSHLHFTIVITLLYALSCKIKPFHITIQLYLSSYLKISMHIPQYLPQQIHIRCVQLWCLKNMIIHFLGRIQYWNLNRNYFVWRCLRWVWSEFSWQLQLDRLRFRNSRNYTFKLHQILCWSMWLILQSLVSFRGG